MLSVAFAVSAFVALASGQSISSGCLTSLAGVASNPSASACLNTSPLISVFVSSGNSSIVTPIDTWLTGLCAATPCSNSTIDAIATNITAGCRVELQALGLQNANALQQAYPVLRNVGCLKDNNDGGTLCVTQSLKNIESVEGPLTISSLTSWFSSGLPQSVNSNVTCTNCVKQTYNVINQQAPGFLGSSTASSLKSTCGDSFIDGQTPAGISESASSQATPTPQSSALGLSLPLSGTLGSASALVLLSGAFAFLA